VVGLLGQQGQCLPLLGQQGEALPLLAFFNFLCKKIKIHATY